MLFSFFLLSQILITGSVAQFFNPTGPLTLFVKGEVGENSLNGHSMESFNVIVTDVSGMTQLLRAPINVTTSFRPISFRLPRAIRQIQIQAVAPEFIMTRGRQLASSGITLDLSRIVINGFTQPRNSMVLQAGGLIIPTDVSNASELKITPARPHQIFLSHPRQNSTGCDDPAVTNKVCFSLKGNVGVPLPTMNEQVNIGYIDGHRRMVTLFQNYDLNDQFDRFLITPNPGTTIDTVFVSLIDNSTLTVNGTARSRLVTIDVDNFFINGTKFNEPHKLFTGGVFRSQWLRSIKGGAPNVSLNASEADLVASNLLDGILPERGIYHIQLPRAQVNSSVCDDPVSSKNAICFSLKGTIGRHLPLEAERVSVSYLTESGRIVNVHNTLPLTEDWERFAIVPRGNETISRVDITFVNDRCCLSFIDTAYDANVLFKMDSLSWNGETFESASSGIGGPVVERFRSINDMHRINIIKNNGHFAWRGVYTISKPVSSGNLSSVCDDETITNKVCWEMRGDLQHPFEQKEVVDIFWVDLNNVTKTVIRNYQLSGEFKKLGIELTSPIRRLVIKFLNDKDWIENGTRYDRNVMVNLNSFILNGTSVPEVKSLISSPNLALNPQVLDGFWLWAGEYWINFDKLTPQS